MNVTKPVGAPRDARMKFAEVCALMPEGVHWGVHLTPQIARELIEVGAHLERNRLKEATRKSGQ